MSRELRLPAPPIMLLGTHRSGTTWLGGVFGQSQEVAYWPEPRQVWVYGNWFRPDDVLTEADARPAVVRHIERRFAQFTQRRGQRIFCEKTPSNCLRVRFVRAVFPQGRFILLVRDGRAVIRSTREILERGGALWRRIWERVWEATPSEWPAYLERWPWLVSKLTGRTNPFWGTRPPGWKDWFRDDPPDVFLAKQWAATIARAHQDIQAIPADQRRIIKYEELLSAPREWVEELAEFSGLSDPQPFIDALLATRDASREGVWRESWPVDETNQLRPHLEPTLNKLGYSW